MLIYQMPTFLQNRKSSRTNYLFALFKTNPIAASTSLPKRELFDQKSYELTTQKLWLKFETSQLKYL